MYGWLWPKEKEPDDIEKAKKRLQYLRDLEIVEERQNRIERNRRKSVVEEKKLRSYNY